MDDEDDDGDDVNMHVMYILYLFLWGFKNYRKLVSMLPCSNFFYVQVCFFYLQSSNCCCKVYGKGWVHMGYIKSCY